MASGSYSANKERRKKGKKKEWEICVTWAIFHPKGHQFPYLESDRVASSNFGNQYSMFLDLEQPHWDLTSSQKEAIKGNTLDKK